MLSSKSGLTRKRPPPSLPPAIQSYYDEPSELIESQGLVLRGEQLVVPLSFEKDKGYQVQ